MKKSKRKDNKLRIATIYNMCKNKCKQCLYYSWKFKISILFIIGGKLLTLGYGSVRSTIIIIKKTPPIIL